MKSDPVKLVEKNPSLNHLEDSKVVSHVQRDDGAWVLHTVMIEGSEVPFKFKRQSKYKSLSGALVNMTYYPTVETVAGIEFEVMSVVRIKRA